MLELDPITGQPRLVVPGRANRPHGGERGCPFCAGHESMTPAETGRRQQPQGPWQARSFPNRWPLTEPHEVIVPSPRHVTRWRELQLPELQRALDLVLERRMALATDHLDRYVHAFVNDGPAAGASISHVHAQLAVLPRGAWNERLTANVATADTCAICRLVRDQLELCIEQGARHALLAHPSPRMAGGLVLVPLAHEAPLEPSAELAELLHRALQAVEPGLASNLWIVADPAEPGHWYVELQPRPANLAGLELALGLSVATSTAEASAVAARERLAMRR